MKKTLSLLLVLAMVLGSFSFAFADEAKVDPAVEAGEFLKKAGVLEGSDSGDLMLDKQLKRQDAVVLLSRLMKAEEEAKKFPVTEEYPTFKDITNNYYKPYLAWAQANKYYEGHNAEKFGYGEFLTAQQYATVLLRALGYEVNDAEAYKAAFETAKKLGIMKDLKVEEKAEITRGQMAQMTFNALGLKMKGSDKTLAEFLGIEMPAPAELKVEKVYTENLKEIVVELSNAKLVDKEKLADANNYKMTGNVVQKATVEGNNVTLLLKEALVKGREYELVVRGIDKAINSKFKFKANDNTIPSVEKVEVLGEYGIKVTTSEPVANVKERNFLVDGKNVAMEVEQYGRNIILTPYHKASFPEAAKALTVKGLEDFAGYKSIEENFDIKVVKDEVAPKVVDVVGRGNKVEVVFDKDIYNDSIEAYYSRVSVGNISYESGRHSVYAEDAEKIDTNRVVYTFKDELPRRTVVTIVDVANHSQVAMEKTTMEVREVLDNIEPEIIDKKVYTDSKDKTATIELYFNKDVKGEFVKNSDTKFVPKDHFTLYEREVLNRNILEGRVKSAEYKKDGKDVRKDVVVVELENLNVNNKDKDYNYILEVVGFVDASSLRNKMYRDYVDFDVKAATTAFKVLDVIVNKKTAETEITVVFNKAVDRTLAEDPTNYIFTHTNKARYDVKDLKGDIITERNGKDVTLVLPEFNPDKYVNLRILDTIKDKDENRLAGVATYVFGENYEALVERAKDAETDAIALLPTTGTDTTNEAALRVALKDLTDLKDKDGKYVKSNHNDLVKAIEAVEEAIEKVEKDNSGKATTKKEELNSALLDAEKVYNALDSNGKNKSEARELAAEIAIAKSVLNDKNATETAVIKETTNLVAKTQIVKDLVAVETFKKDHAKVLALTTATVKPEDEEAVNAALAAFAKLSVGAQGKLTAEKSLLDSLKAKLDEDKAGSTDQAMVDAELAKVPAEIVLTGSTTVDEAAVKAAVEAKVDLNKVKVAVVDKTGGAWEVTLTSKAATGKTAVKNITVTVLP